MLVIYTHKNLPVHEKTVLYRRLFVGNHAEAEQFKGLITEPSYRSEKKFCEPLNITSYHNFVGASNSHKAVAISTDDRRYWMKTTVGMKYAEEHWTHLWSLVDNPSTCVDLTGFPTRAPMTSSKADAAAEQCPVAIKWLKTAILEQPNCAASVPAWVGDDYAQRTAWEDDKLKMTFKNRVHNSRPMRAFLEEGYEKMCLSDDLAKRSSVTCVLPLNHIAACVCARFKGQSLMKCNEDEMKRDFDKLELKTAPVRLAGATRRGVIRFPSIEGCIYLLRKKGWMTAAELALEDEED